MSRTSRVGLAQVSLAGILWGTGGLGVQLIREQVPMSVLTISAWRMGLAAIVLVGAVLLLRRTPDLLSLMRQRPRRAVVVGLSTASYQALYFGAVVLAGVTVATVVSLGLAPVLLTLAEAVRDRQRPGRTRLLVLGTALTGLVLVSLAGHATATGPHPTAGALAAVASGAAYAFATWHGEILARTTTPLALTTVTTSVGVLGLIPVALLPFDLLGGGPLVTADPEVLALLAYLGLLTMALAYGLLYAGLRTTSSSAATLATLLEPVTAAGVAALVLDERVGPLGVLGTGLVLAAVAGLTREDPLAQPSGTAVVAGRAGPSEE